MMWEKNHYISYLFGSLLYVISFAKKNCFLFRTGKVF